LGIAEKYGWTLDAVEALPILWRERITLYHRLTATKAK
jgi:hypothetical protein